MPGLKIKNKSGLFLTSGTLETNHLALGVSAFSSENVSAKLEKLKSKFLDKLIKKDKLTPEQAEQEWSKVWQDQAAKLIKSFHTVLAQHNPGRTDFPCTALNAGGILNFVTTDENGKPVPLGMMMLKEKDGLQLGFGKVELRDLDKGLASIQARFDAAPQEILLKILGESRSYEDFITRIKNDPTLDIKRDEMLNTFSSVLEPVFTANEDAISGIFARLDSHNEEKLPNQESSFGRPTLNRFATKASKNAAVREILEELKFTLDEKSINENRLSVQSDINRAEATNDLRGVLREVDPTKFSAVEGNSDFESSAYIVNCAVTREEFARLKPDANNCMLIIPNRVQVHGRIEVIKGKEIGMLQTTIEGYPPILGGGNQFFVASCCNKVYGIPVTCSNQPRSVQDAAVPAGLNQTAASALPADRAARPASPTNLFARASTSTPSSGPTAPGEVRQDTSGVKIKP